MRHRQKAEVADLKKYKNSIERGDVVNDYEQVLEVFFSMIRIKHELPESLVERWFFMACYDFEHDIAPLNYDPDTKMFKNASGVIFNMLGLMMSISHLKRERNRINQLQNIVGRDLQLNATQFSKAALLNEYNTTLSEIEALRFKLKQHAFG